VSTPLRAIRIPADLWKAALAKAASAGTTVTAVVIAALRRYVSGAVVLSALLTLVAMPPAQGAVTLVPPVLADSSATCARVAHDPQGALVIGDSITASGFSDIKTRLATLGHPSCINARLGRPTAEGVDVLRTYIRTTGIPHTVILALGTNDTLGADTMPANIRAAMFAAGSSTRVFWVNVFNAQSSRPVEALTQSRQIDSALWQADHFYWNLAVVDWFSYIAPRAYYLLQSDGMHPTGLGNQARTTLLLNGILHLWTRTGVQTMPRPS